MIGEGMGCPVSIMRGVLRHPLCKGGQGGYALVRVRRDLPVMSPNGGIIKTALFGCGLFSTMLTREIRDR